MDKVAIAENLATMEKLFAVDPMSFARAGDTYMYQCCLTNRIAHMTPGVDVVLAWAMLMRMQDRLVLFNDAPIAYQIAHHPEMNALKEALEDNWALAVTKENITEWYIAWKESTDTQEDKG